MRKIVVTLVVATLLSATAAPVSADGWNGYYYRGVDPLWPITWPINVALAIPAAIIGTVANALTPGPVGYYAAPPAPYYSGPAAYYSPGPYYAPRAYYAPRGYYSPRGYYPARYYRTYRRGW